MHPNQKSKSPIISLPSNTIPMPIKATNLNSRKYQKHIKSSPIPNSNSSMTLLEYLGKDGPKWDLKLNKVSIPTKNIKMFSTACLQNKESSFKDKLKQDSEGS